MTNRFTGTDFTFDKIGNITRDISSTNQARQFVFNGENKQTEIRDLNIAVNASNSDANVIGRYYYDGEGKRVKKVTNTETTVFVYSSGKLVAEYSTKTPPQNPTTSYTTTDHLGTPRVITDALGQVKSRRDFMPFGEELTINVGGRSGSLKYGTTDDIRQKFTGYQKDEETGLDFAEARMYENRHARFTAVDPLLASGKSANPQTFNRYVYVGNSPLVITDPTGLFGDYYDRKGQYIASDKKGSEGFEDGKNYFATRGETYENGDVEVTNWQEVKWEEIVEARNGGAFTASSFFSESTVGDVRAPMRNFLNGFPEAPFTEAATGTIRGIGNIPIDIANGVTFLANNSGRVGIGLGLTWDNPLAIERFACNSNIQCNFSNGVAGASVLAAPVAAAPFRGLTSLSFAKEGFDAVGAFRNAISPFKGGNLTNAGRGVTKHPGYFGFESADALMKVHRSPSSLNQLGSSALKDVLRNGIRTTGAGGRYPNGWVTHTLPNGNAASWRLDGTFIGFRGLKR